MIYYKLEKCKWSQKDETFNCKRVKELKTKKEVLDYLEKVKNPYSYMIYKIKFEKIHNYFLNETLEYINGEEFIVKYE